MTLSPGRQSLQLVKTLPPAALGQLPHPTMTSSSLVSFNLHRALGQGKTRVICPQVTVVQTRVSEMTGPRSDSETQSQALKHDLLTPRPVLWSQAWPVGRGTRERAGCPHVGLTCLGAECRGGRGNILPSGPAGKPREGGKALSRGDSGLWPPAGLPSSLLQAAREAGSSRPEVQGRSGCCTIWEEVKTSISASASASERHL